MDDETVERQQRGDPDPYLGASRSPLCLRRRLREAIAKEMYCQTERTYGITVRMNVLAQLFCSRIRAGILRVLFGLHRDEMHLREIQRQTGFALGTVRQDIEKMVKMGLVVRRKDGNRVCYTADIRHPLTADLRQLVLKTVGLVDVLKTAIEDSRIKCAFVFGSVAAGTAGAESDLDLMIIGEVGLREASGMLSGVGLQLGREINVVTMTPSEFCKRAVDREHLISSVLQAPKIFVIGSDDDLRAMAV